jgi:hypothetical protein
MRVRAMTKPDADKPTNGITIGNASQHSPYWYKRYWFWMAKRKKPGEAAELATQDEKTLYIHDPRGHGGRPTKKGEGGHR